MLYLSALPAALFLSLLIAVSKNAEALEDGESLSRSPSRTSQYFVEARAVFNMRGISGHVVFSEYIPAISNQSGPAASLNRSDQSSSVSERKVSVEYKLSNSQWSKPLYNKDELFLVLREFPVIWNGASDACSDASLGKQ